MHDIVDLVVACNVQALGGHMLALSSKGHSAKAARSAQSQTFEMSWRRLAKNGVANLWDDATKLLKVIDFSLSEAATTTGPPGNEVLIPVRCNASVYFTRNYRAPEIYTDCLKKIAANVQAKCDIWAVGCILFEMKAGEQFLQGNTSAEVRMSLNSVIVSTQAFLHRMVLAGSWRFAVSKMMCTSPVGRSWAFLPYTRDDGVDR